MADKKEYTPKQAAIAVLKKFEELLTKAEKDGKGKLIKAEKKMSKEDPMGMMYSEKKPADKMEKKYEGFKAVEESAKESGASDPAAVAAAAGRKKYGKKAFQEAAAEGHKMGKSDENPDEKEDAKLGEKVEHDVEDHMHANKEAEKEEGHQSWDKDSNVKGHIKLAKFLGHIEGKRAAKIMPDSGNEPSEKIDYNPADMNKADGESKHDRCVKDVKENSPEVKNPHAVCVAEGVKPAKWKK